VSQESWSRVVDIDERQAIPFAAGGLDMMALVVAKFLRFHRYT
jgi:hypothetical protein